MYDGLPRPSTSPEFSTASEGHRTGFLTRPSLDIGPQEPVYFEGTLVDLQSPSASRPLLACRGLFQETLSELAVETWFDYHEFYSRRGLTLLGLGIGTAAILANTSLDQDFQNWHDVRVRGQQVQGNDAGEIASRGKWFGDGRLWIPVYAATTLLEPLGRSHHPWLGTIGQWGSRCTRSILVGGPTVLALKYLLNGSRPEDEIGSRWRPFDEPYSEGAVSGHSFLGALPFINAAKMTDGFVLKTVFYGLSVLPAWSRIHDRMHFLSQAILGWWIAYLSAEAAHRTELFQRNLIVTPYMAGDGVGVQAMFRW